MPGLPASRGAENFHIYAPERGKSTLHVVGATDDGQTMKLEIVQEREVGIGLGSVAAHPELPVLYLGGAGGAGGSAAATVAYLGDDGMVSAVKNYETASGHGYVSVHPSKKLLLGSNYREGTLHVYRLDEHGQIGELVATLDEGRPNAHAALASRDGRFLYVPYVKDANALLQYRIDVGAGKLVVLDPPDAGPPADTGPRHPAFHPTLPVVYFSNEQQVGASAYTIGEDGALSLLQVSESPIENPPVPGMSASDIAITPDGKFLFTGLRSREDGASAITRFAIGVDGMLTLLGTTPADAIPWGMALSPDGKVLLVSATTGQSLTAYRIGDDGGLSEAAKLVWGIRVTDLVTR